MKTYFNHKEPFSIEKFVSILNGDAYFINKPKGGLWTAPNHDWLNWCSSEEPGWITDYYELEVDDQRLLRIFDEATLRTVPTIVDPNFPHIMIDWESLVTQGYSGVWVNARAMRWCDQPNFYAWDCETILIFDPSIIKSITPIPIPNEYLPQIQSIEECEKGDVK